MADNNVFVTGSAEVQAALKRAMEAIGAGRGDGGIGLGLKRAALHLIARAKALAPEDTTTLVQSIHSDGRVQRSGDTVRVEVGAHATTDRSAEKDVKPNAVPAQNAGGTPLVSRDEENYGWIVHEDQDYEGPNVGGSRTIGLGEKTAAKGQSKVEPSDGSAGGKYMSRPIQNKPEVYAEILARTIKEVLDGGGK